MVYFMFLTVSFTNFVWLKCVLVIWLKRLLRLCTCILYSCRVYLFGHGNGEDHNMFVG